MKEQDILKKSYNLAKKLKISAISKDIAKDIDIVIENIDSNKSLVSAITTSLVKKIVCPSQDIRLHRTSFDNGYSARVLDTKVTAPFFKEKFTKYANKESAFLTLAVREQIKWTKNEGIHLKIRNKELKTAFLNIFEQVEVNSSSPEHYLQYLLFKLIELSKKDQDIFKLTKSKSAKNEKVLNINLLITMLSEHFKCKLGSRLPVIAIYSIYEILLPCSKRYKDKLLMPLQVHTSSDKHGYGDIEIYYKKNRMPFEIIEIKHDIAIDKYLITDIAKKTENKKIDRYYILTTFPASFKNKTEEKKVFLAISQLNQERGIDIIANGVITTLKYYLRFINNYDIFLKSYTDNLIKDAKHSTEIKDFHLNKWNEIREKHLIQ